MYRKRKKLDAIFHLLYSYKILKLSVFFGQLKLSVYTLMLLTPTLYYTSLTLMYTHSRIHIYKKLTLILLILISQSYSIHYFLRIDTRMRI